MAKKKKTQLKPVARGFATTSVPKKAVQPVEAVEEGNTADDEPLMAEVEESIQPVASHNQSDEFDPEKAEEQSLQNLVDRLQERTEKEVTRSVSKPYNNP